MDEILCNYCKEEKDEAYAQGKGIEWRPNCEFPCRTVACILSERVAETAGYWLPKRDDYADADVSDMWVYEPPPVDDSDDEN